MPKIAFFELQQFRPQPTDWNRVMLDLRRAGVSYADLAAALDVSESALEKWRNHGFQPRHDIGAALLAMHAKYCKK